MSEEIQFPFPEDYDPRAHYASGSEQFRNPWPSFDPRELHRTALFKAKLGAPTAVPVPDKWQVVSVIKPDFAQNDSNRCKTKVTWLGHASFLLEFPHCTKSERGFRVLLDPFFSDRAGPLTFIGPKRFTPAPCRIQDLPELDCVCLSHNHYDHTDRLSLISLWKDQQERFPTLHLRLFVGLRFETWCLSNIPGLQENNVLGLDWFQGKRLLRQGFEGFEKLDVYCTPAQHESHRSVTDKNFFLWCSWTFVHTLAVTSGGQALITKIHFAGKPFFFSRARLDKGFVWSCRRYRLPKRSSGSCITSRCAKSLSR